jgi:hypothetical protein
MIINGMFEAKEANTGHILQINDTNFKIDGAWKKVIEMEAKTPCENILKIVAQFVIQN